MAIDISPDPETPIKKEWKVPLLYRCKGDAKIAVMCAAADDGMMDFIKYRGNPPPIGHELRQGTEDASQVAESNELEEGETLDDIKKKKKKKKGKKDVVVEGCKGETEDMDVVKDLKACKTECPVGAPLSEMREAALVRGRFDKRGRQQHSSHGRVRGGGLGRPPFRDEFGGNNPNAWRMGPQSGFGPAFGPGHPRPVGGFFPPPVPHFHQPRNSAFSRGPGFPGGAYRPRHEHLDRSYHLADPGLANGRHAHGTGARTAADTKTSFAHAPPPAPPHGTPAYNAYLEGEQDHDYARDRQGPYLQPSFSGAAPIPAGARPGAVRPPCPPPPPSPGQGYPDAAPGTRRLFPPPHMYHPSRATDYRYKHDEYAGRPARAVSRARGPEHYAPDYDRIPDRDAVAREPPPPPPPHFHTNIPLHRSTNTASVHQGSTRHSSRSHSSLAPTHHSHPGDYSAHPPYIEHRTPGELPHVPATYDRPAQPASVVPEDEVTRRRSVYERELDIEKSRALALASRPPRLHKSDSQVHTKLEETFDNVISRPEGEADQGAALPLEGDAPDGGGERECHANV